ncbi:MULTISPECIES: hypothetical protein [Acidiphilium]|uniref:hypothetical protein n=1 Tax=Acidiphilium TaxID=522 RepID=UPI00257CE14E|nr:MULTISPECIES: hypothetical protein [Acidiphilium]HQT83547.1 hypothetical protein [Acidiphilium rubrum]
MRFDVLTNQSIGFAHQLGDNFAPPRLAGDSTLFLLQPQQSRADLVILATIILQLALEPSALAIRKLTVHD